MIVKKKESEDIDSSNNLVHSFETYLKGSRKKEIKSVKDKKLNVLVGKCSEGLEAETCNIEPQVSSSKTLNTEFEKAHFKKSKKKMIQTLY